MQVSQLLHALVPNVTLNSRCNVTLLILLARSVESATGRLVLLNLGNISGLLLEGSRIVRWVGPGTALRVLLVTNPVALWHRVDAMA